MTLYEEARTLYDLAFPGEAPAFAEALFDAYFEKQLRTVFADGRLASMLFSIPYSVISASGVQDARYLYAIATHPQYRGRGYAKQLIAREAEEHPVFLRPMSPSLFDFYAKAGLVPFSPITVYEGAAQHDARIRAERLSIDAYLALREKLAPRPVCRMTEQFLGVASVFGGMVGVGEACAALFDRDGERVIFKEWWGNADFAPHIAAYLGASSYELRLPDASGAPFGVMQGLSPETLFLAAMD